MIQPSLGLGDLEQDLWHLLFIMVRIGAAMIAAPMFGATSVPVQIRIILAGALSCLIMQWSDVQLPAQMLNLETFLILLNEVVIGLAMGFVLQMTFAAPVLAAEQISGTMGMAIATAVDPNSGGRSGALGQYFTVVLTLVFLMLGGHLLWLALVVKSYTMFPPGGDWFGPDRAFLIVSFAGQMFATGLAIGLPITLVLLLVQLVTGVISRSAPALNLFALGLPAGILAGLAALIAAAPMVTEQFTLLVADGLDQTQQVLER